MNKQKEGWVLIVDDDVDNRVVISIVLQHSGCRTVGCSNGLEAIKALIHAYKEDHMSEAIFLDINMPLFNGWEVLELMEMAQPKIQNISVVLMTAEAVSPTVKKKFILKKPFDMEQLNEVLPKVGCAHGK